MTLTKRHAFDARQVASETGASNKWQIGKYYCDEENATYIQLDGTLFCGLGTANKGQSGWNGVSLDTGALGRRGAEEQRFVNLGSASVFQT